ncbi:MAG: threonine/serine dehydratase [Deltaproteobacteria bacterium]|nr:threonine/serine dehydratase [Deltaproteobacteria bacterium]
MNVKNEVLKAEKRIREYIRTTPLDFSPHLSEICNCNIYLKLESEQLTGSFKIRGAMNKLLSLSKSQKERGIITASTGNHALAVASGLQKLNVRGTIYLPENAAKSKIEAIRCYNAPIKFHGKDCVETEIYARGEAEKRGMVFISPYNDSQIIAGQGTIGIEILEQLPEVDTVFAPVGGGGLISGIAGYLKSLNKKIKIFGCLPVASPVMSESIKAGKIIEMETKETLSDGTAGGIESGAITFNLCRNYVDDYFLVTEEEIKEAIYLMLKKNHKVIEGASALTVAVLLRNKEKFKDRNIVLVISGCNVSIEKLKNILCG